MSPKYLIFALIAVALCSTRETRGAKLKFTFHVTSMCSATRKFVTSQLHPVYQELGQYFDLEFVAWGKSSRSEESEGEIECQFGEKDCIGNKIQTCVYHLIGDDQSKLVDYVDCEMRNLTATEENYYCAEKVGISSQSAKQCYESDLGDELQRQAEAKTKGVTMFFMPTIVYNDMNNYFVQVAAYRQFRFFVCLMLAKEKPEACRKSSYELEAYDENGFFNKLMLNNLQVVQVFNVYNELGNGVIHNKFN